MKNIIKKITAITMAFTLLGSGTAIAKNVSPKSDNTLTASAATCLHHGYRYSTTSNWVVYRVEPLTGKVKLHQKRTVYVRCGSCDRVVNTYIEYRSVIQ